MIPFPIHLIRLAVPISSGTQCIIWKCPSVAIYKITALANTYIYNQPEKSEPASNLSISSSPTTLQNWDAQVI